jgi:hypothetical protein
MSKVGGELLGGPEGPTSHLVVAMNGNVENAQLYGEMKTGKF